MTTQSNPDEKEQAIMPRIVCRYCGRGPADGELLFTAEPIHMRERAKRDGGNKRVSYVCATHVDHPDIKLTTLHWLELRKWRARLMGTGVIPSPAEA